MLGQEAFGDESVEVLRLAVTRRYDSRRCDKLSRSWSKQESTNVVARQGKVQSRYLRGFRSTASASCNCGHHPANFSGLAPKTGPADVSGVPASISRLLWGVPALMSVGSWQGQDSQRAKTFEVPRLLNASTQR